MQKMLQPVSDMKYPVDIKLAPQKPTFEDDRLNQMGDREYATRQILVYDLGSSRTITTW